MKCHTQYQNHFGREHIETAWVSSCLGSLYKKIGKYEKAKQYLHESLSVYKKHYLQDHVETSRVLAKLASIEAHLGRHTQAHNMLAPCLDVYREFYGEAHVEMAWMLRTKGEIYLMEQNWLEAEKYFKRALEIYQHHNSAKSGLTLESIAHLYLKKAEAEKESMGQKNLFYKKSQHYFQKSREVLERCYPKNSPHLERVERSLKIATQKSVLRA